MARTARAVAAGMRLSRTVALVSLTVAFVVIACGDGEDGGPSVTPTLADAGEVEKADCPAIPPAEGAECLLPEGTTCAFDVCSGRIARCSQGVWRRATNAPARVECPDPPPGPGDPCPPCWAPETACTYGAECSSPDAGERRALARCPGATWEVSFEVCRDGASGPDVQGDADTDSG